MCCLRHVFGHAQTSLVANTKVLARLRVPLTSATPKPLHRLLKILCDSSPFVKEGTQIVLCSRIVGRLGRVSCQAFEYGIDEGNIINERVA